MTWGILALLVLLLAGAGVYVALRARGMEQWAWSYALDSRKRRAVSRDEPVHLLLCIADHFEPDTGGASHEQARRRVEQWVEGYPRLAQNFHDEDGRPPRYTFFYPLETYDAEHLDMLASLCREGYGEVEVHLHHDKDTAAALAERLRAYKALLAERHGLLSRRPGSGEIAYGFIHGNWSLDNSLPDGRWCGVNNELDVLRETGCYADFTLPSAPSPAQTRTINRIYYAVDDPLRPKSHDRGIAVNGRPAPDRSLLLIQGPLLLDWRRRKWGLLPRIENACLQANQAPTLERLELWLKARVQVAGRPDWFFVKLHTHGATEANQEVLLGEPMAEFHRCLARKAREDSNFHVHYVTAREMYNLVRAAEAGWRGSVNEARDFELQWNR